LDPAYEEPYPNYFHSTELAERHVLNAIRRTKNAHDFTVFLSQPKRNGIYIFKGEDVDRGYITHIDPYQWKNNSTKIRNEYGPPNEVVLKTWFLSLQHADDSKNWIKDVYYVPFEHCFLVHYRGNPKYGRKFDRSAAEEYPLTALVDDDLSSAEEEEDPKSKNQNKQSTDVRISEVQDNEDKAMKTTKTIFGKANPTQQIQHRRISTADAERYLKRANSEETGLCNPRKVVITSPHGGDIFVFNIKNIKDMGIHKWDTRRWRKRSHHTSNDMNIANYDIHLEKYPSRKFSASFKRVVYHSPLQEKVLIHYIGDKNIGV